MKRILLGIAFGMAALLCGKDVKAQFPYNVTTQTQAYVPLTNATSVNKGEIWYDTSSFTIPVGFFFKLGSTSVNTITLGEAIFIAAAGTGPRTGFVVLGTSLQDRNVGKMTSVSPISYTTTGSAGNKIFKLEVANAGFTEEAQYNTDDDSISYQVWIYENNSVVEVRFGPSRVSHFGDYFGNKVLTGYMKNMNPSTGTFDKFWLLSGNPATPTLDSMQTIVMTKGLNTLPASGTVYRYVPKMNSTGIGQAPKVSLGRIYPSPAVNELTIESTAAGHFEVISVTGSAIISGSITAGKQPVDVSSLPSGVYAIRLTNDRQEADVIRFVKQ